MILPETRDTLVAALASDGPAERARALDLIARAYRDPVVAVLAIRWTLNRADAEDLAQAFFARAIEKNWFHRYNPDRGRFRTFLRSCLDDFARAEFRDAQRVKRGGAAEHVDIADDQPSEPAAIDSVFDREWTRSVLAIACERLRVECEEAERRIAWQLFQHYDLSDQPDEDRPTYASMAIEFGESATQVTNHLAWARRRMREHVLATIRSLTGDEREYREEVRALLGIEVQ